MEAADGNSSDPQTIGPNFNKGFQTEQIYCLRFRKCWRYQVLFGLYFRVFGKVKMWNMGLFGWDEVE